MSHEKGIGIWYYRYSWCLYLYLKERGYDVIAVGHRKDDNGFFDLHDMKYYSVDICNKDDFNNFQWLAFTVLFILRGIFPARMKGYNPQKNIDVNIIGTLTILHM